MSKNDREESSVVRISHHHFIRPRGIVLAQFVHLLFDYESTNAALNLTILPIYKVNSGES